MKKENIVIAILASITIGVVWFTIWLMTPITPIEMRQQIDECTELGFNYEVRYNISGKPDRVNCRVKKE